MQDRLADLEGLRAVLIARMRDGGTDAAEVAAARMIEIEPDDIQALNCLGKICKDRGDGVRAVEFYDRVLAVDPANKVANNQLERLGVATDGNALGRRRSVKTVAGDTTWTYGDAFPFVVDVIDRLYGQSHEWVPWVAVRDGLLIDPDASRDIGEWARRQDKSAFKVASDIMAHWTRSITVGINPYESTHERRDSDYALRPRRGRS